MHRMFHIAKSIIIQSKNRRTAYKVNNLANQLAFITPCAGTATLQVALLLQRDRAMLNTPRACQCQCQLTCQCR